MADSIDEPKKINQTKQLICVVWYSLCVFSVSHTKTKNAHMQMMDGSPSIWTKKILNYQQNNRNRMQRSEYFESCYDETDGRLVFLSLALIISLSESVCVQVKIYFYSFSYVWMCLWTKSNTQNIEVWAETSGMRCHK